MRPRGLKISHMKALHVWVALFCLCFFQQTSFAQSAKEDCDNPCGQPTVWDEFNAFTLKVTTAGESGYQFWQGKFDGESKDIQIEVQRTDVHSTVNGKILLVGGRVMATQGPVVDPGYEIDALDAPVLSYKLLVRLLGEALPKGPPTTSGKQAIDFKNEKTGVRFATPSAEGFIAPPWSLAGEVEVVRPDEVHYQLALTVTSSEGGVGATTSRQHTTGFVGQLTKSETAKISDAMTLDGWAVSELGVQTRKDSNGTSFDYGAAPAAPRFKVVADIRKKIIADDYAGEADPSKNFTGFWKQNCEEAFGLQIMPYGKGGRYSVTFCGPGGCGTPGEDGKNTFITKDPDYEVISESEVRIRRADNDWDTYHRCTTETHPVLKYKDE